MRQDNKVLENYSEPKYVFQVGDYHGVILIDYTPDKKYETYIDLTLTKDDKHFVTFFAKMNYNESYTASESKFGYSDDFTAKVKQIVRNTPFYQVNDVLHSFMPIGPEVFIDLVEEYLHELYNIKEKFICFQIADKEIKKYYNQDADEEKLISYQSINDYFYVCKSIFECRVSKSEKLMIDDYNFPDFPEILLTFTWLKEIELYELIFSDIPEDFTRLKNLKSLSLKLKFLDKLPSTLQRLTELEKLKLERTSITELPDNLFELDRLKELMIVNNKGLKRIPEIISRLKNLEFLYLHSNDLSSIPKTIFRLENLKVLHLGNNKIEEIPAELTALPGLRVLNLKGNRFKKLPDDLFEMKSIEEVDLSNNPSLNSDEVYDLLMKSGRRDKINLVL
ncbi:MAG: leucine-rich repeat domain-containing protein [bacterium]|nr:leucine-rich repeat domain-containing protein [bacterium]